MTLSAQFSLLHSDLNDFLFATISDGTVQTLGDHAALAKVGSSLAIRSNRCPNPAPSVPL